MESTLEPIQVGQLQIRYLIDGTATEEWVFSN